jgi:hypothetical protein
MKKDGKKRMINPKFMIKQLKFRKQFLNTRNKYVNLSVWHLKNIPILVLLDKNTKFLTIRQ